MSIILDYYGIPGSGKSTVSHQKAEELKADGKSVVEPSYFFDHVLGKRKRKLYKLISSAVYCIRHPHKYRQVVSLVQENGYTKGNGFRHQIVNIVYKLRKIETSAGKYDYVVFDEGIAQAAVSLSVNSGGSCIGNLNRLVSLICVGDIRFQRIETDVMTALERVEKRNSKDTRIEKFESRSERAEWMKRYLVCVENIDAYIQQRRIAKGR